MNNFIRETERSTPIAFEADLCVIGGSCTGVFAAVNAARLGLKVALIEAQGFLGGMATGAAVCVWHSIYDCQGKNQIVGGLTTELMDRMISKGNAEFTRECNEGQIGYKFNPWEMVIEQDKLVKENNIRPFLHTRFCAPVVDETGAIDAVIIEDKTGRRAIKSKFFIDASGDADLAHRAGFKTRKDSHLQPPTMCAVVKGLKAVEKANPGFILGDEVFSPKYPESLKPGFIWGIDIPGIDGDIQMVAGTRVHGMDCSDADQLTQAEIEGRRQVGAICDLLRNHFKEGKNVHLSALPSMLGIRESRHVECLYTVNETELLNGCKFEDGIANSCYKVDIHRMDKGGNIFRCLDGREIISTPGEPNQISNWLPEGQEPSDYYQVPFRSMIPQNSSNLLIAGRSIDADRGAFSAIRVMQNCNQMGEAAGVAAFQCLNSNVIPKELDPSLLRSKMRDLGSII